ncbi:MAG: alpha/beta fold hydrolase [Planctomycetales bacterium]|nr:alpha/beta fold hydrolase [Planctomycetales bacterium]
MIRISLAIARFLAFNLLLVSLCAAKGPWDLDSYRQAPDYKWVDDSGPIRSFLFESEPYQGHPTEVFGFYATPGTLRGDTTTDKNLPAVVLLHGGGGTAFAEWTMLWAQRGYAAIAVDLCGNRPAAPAVDPDTGKLSGSLREQPKTRVRLERGGPPEGAESKFKNVGGNVTDDWQYHAVAAAMRAHSLVRSFPEVDPDRTAVTGISWGGYLTCLVASLDDRFKAAVPVYGCGFLYEGESVQRPQIDSLSAEQRGQWIREYEPSAWLGQCKVPILFVNGTNDKHYPLPSYMRSYRLVQGEKMLRIEPHMRHGHPPGWAPKEIGLFIDHYLRGGDPLAKIGSVQQTENIASATYESNLPIKQAQIHFTSDRGPLVDRTWQNKPATAKDGKITAEIPADATIWMLTVTDSRDAMVSSEVDFAD